MGCSYTWDDRRAGDWCWHNHQRVKGSVRLRKQALGNLNIVGTRVKMARESQGMKQRELATQLKSRGVDMYQSDLSKLEGQIRHVMDYELSALADILNVSVDWLLGRTS